MRKRPKSVPSKPTTTSPLATGGNPFLIAMTNTFTSEFQPGIYNNLDEKAYRADGALSTSDFKLLADCPAQFHAQQDGSLERVNTEAFRIGSLFHLYALQREEWDKSTVLCPEEYLAKRSNASKSWWAMQAKDGREVYKPGDLKQIRAMYDSYHALKSVTDATRQEYNTEVSVFCQGMIGKNDTKCRVDLMTKPVNGEVTVIDIKTTAAGGAHPRKFASSSKAFHYHWQQANYTRMLAKHGIKVIKWVWAVVEKEAPYKAAEYTFSESDMAYAMKELQEADKRLLACQELDAWPSYTPSGPVELSLFGGVKL